MANKLYVAEFAQAVSGIGSTYGRFPPQPSIANQIVAVAGAVSAALNVKTNCVLLVTDTACCIKFGSTAGVLANNASDLLLPANTPMMFGVAPGSFISAVTP